MQNELNRRDFLKGAATIGAGAAVVGIFNPASDPNLLAAEADKPVTLGGKAVRSAPFPSWPIIDETEDKAMLDVLHSRKWFRGDGAVVSSFEAAYAQLTGAKHCLATANGTSALIASLGALDVGPGDEVIVPPYTFVATINAVLMHHALPVFVDTDPETFQIDARKIESAISDRSAAIVPVHLGGGVADLDAIMEIATRRKLPVVEDACQAHLAEWRGKKAGDHGSAGCFSFQASKNLNSGEGGAVLTNDDELAERIYSFHNNCRARRTASYTFAYRGTRGANFRLTEFQGGLLLAQMKRLEEQSRTRDENAQYLTAQLGEIPGILPGRIIQAAHATRITFNMFRYQPDSFNALPRAKFLAALTAEGIPCSSGYAPLNTEEFIKGTLKSRAYQRVYPQAILDNWAERMRCPANDQLCQEAVWFTQTMLLGTRQDMDDIVAAVKKIHNYASELAKV